jgi:hypothetical protein
MLTDKSKDEQKRDYEAKAKAEPPAEPAKPEVTEPKGKRSRAKQPVTA